MGMMMMMMMMMVVMLRMSAKRGSSSRRLRGKTMMEQRLLFVPSGVFLTFSSALIGSCQFVVVVSSLHVVSFFNWSLTRSRSRRHRCRRRGDYSTCVVVTVRRDWFIVVVVSVVEVTFSVTRADFRLRLMMKLVMAVLVVGGRL